MEYDEEDEEKDKLEDKWFFGMLDKPGNTKNKHCAKRAIWERVVLNEEEAMECALYWRREIEAEHPEIARLQFLYGAYEPNCFWFEVF